MLTAKHIHGCKNALHIPCPKKEIIGNVCYYVKIKAINILTVFCYSKSTNLVHLKLEKDNN